MRPQTDLLILVTAVIIISDSKTNPPHQLGSLINSYGRSNSRKDKRELY
jgi:hypothetical protein